MRQKNKIADRTQESNDSPEIPDRGKTSGIPSLPLLLKKTIIQHRDLCKPKCYKTNVLHLSGTLTSNSTMHHVYELDPS